MAATIRKAQFAHAGGPEVVSIVTARIELPKADEVQTKVLYAGMGGGDIAMRLGGYPNQRSATGLTPGYSFVGRVHKNGGNCSKFQVGTLVAALTK